jgi:hypothetical protein
MDIMKLSESLIYEVVLFGTPRELGSLRKACRLLRDSIDPHRYFAEYDKYFDTRELTTEGSHILYDKINAFCGVCPHPGLTCPALSILEKAHNREAVKKANEREEEEEDDHFHPDYLSPDFDDLSPLDSYHFRRSSRR